VPNNASYVDCVIALVGVEPEKSLRSFALDEGVRIVEIPPRTIATILTDGPKADLSELAERYLQLRPVGASPEQGDVA